MKCAIGTVMSRRAYVVRLRLIVSGVVLSGSVLVMASDVTRNAANPGFNYYGRWQCGKTAVTINSGALVEFAYTGRQCSLIFDLKGFTRFPVIFVQADSGSVRRTTLAADVSSVTVKPDPKTSGQRHRVRFWVAAHSLYQMPAAGKRWGTQEGGCRFLGVKLEDGERHA